MSIYQFFLFVKFLIVQKGDWRTAYQLAKVVSFLENWDLEVIIEKEE